MVLAVTVVAVFVGLWRYGTDLIDAATGDVFFNWQIFNAFLIASRIGGFLICIVYVLLCVAALQELRDEQAGRS